MNVSPGAGQVICVCCSFIQMVCVSRFLLYVNSTEICKQPREWRDSDIVVGQSLQKSWEFWQWKSRKLALAFTNQRWSIFCRVWSNHHDAEGNGELAIAHWLLICLYITSLWNNFLVWPILESIQTKGRITMSVVYWQEHPDNTSVWLWWGEDVRHVINHASNMPHLSS